MWLLAAVLGGPASAQTAPVDEARALYDQGLRYYQEKDYDTAIRLWERSYAVSPLPAILHNIAKAEEEANLPREALVTWREYFAVAPPEGRAAAEERIRALEVVVAALASVEQEEREAAQTPVPAPATMPLPVEPERQRRSARGLWAGLMAAGATGGVVGGSLLAVQARASAGGLAEDGCVGLGDTTLCDDPTASALRGERLQFVLGAALIGGGVALGGGSVWVAVRPSASDVSIAWTGRW